MTIWAFKGPSTEDYPVEQEYQSVTQFLRKSILNGFSRFGWSYIDEADLDVQIHKPETERTPEEIHCWKNSKFLLEVKAGDWIVHINLPANGMCIAVQVVGTYTFEQEDNEFSEFRHMINIDPATFVEFDRNDEKVSPMLVTRRMGRFWRIKHTEEFLNTIARFKKND